MLSASIFNPMLRATVRKVLPAGVRHALGCALYRFDIWRTKLHLARWRKHVAATKAGTIVDFENYRVRINDGPNFYILYKDIFVKRSYHFEAQRPDPFILDCGSNIGMSILYYKQAYPKARIIGFEPDPVVFGYLQENMTENSVTDVQLVQAAIAGREGHLAFHSDGKYASYLVQANTVNLPDGWTKHNVPCVRLRDYLTQPVDFVKINIEGAEWETIADSEDRLRLVREMVIEYHHLPGLSRTLHKILEVLDRQGFEYLINDFDSETNGSVHPPFCLMPDSCYFLLVYAKRVD